MQNLQNKIQISLLLLITSISQFNFVSHDPAASRPPVIAIVPPVMGEPTLQQSLEHLRQLYPPSNTPQTAQQPKVISCREACCSFFLAPFVGCCEVGKCCCRDTCGHCSERCSNCIVFCQD